MRTASRLVCRTLLLTAILADGFAFAQTLYSRNSKITVAPNTTLAVHGDVDNQGTIVNNGHIKVAGPWINSGTYEPGVGQITFNSSSPTIPQIIHHNGQHFNKVTIGGGTSKVLLSDIVIRDEIHFNNGIVEIAGDARLVFDSGVIIRGASDSSHVNGAVFHHGSGYKLFPIGNGLKYLPVELADVQDPAALIGVRSLEFGNALVSVPPTLASMFRERYWHVHVASGAVANSQIILPLKDASWADDPDKIVVVQSESMTENFASIGRSDAETVSQQGRIKSELNVSMPFVALATAAEEEEIIVFNAVSNNGDNSNDFLRIENIGNYTPNKLTIYSRWGDKVFEIDNYDNNLNVFRGRANINGDAALVSGTYFYVLDIPGRQSIKGFVVVKN